MDHFSLREIKHARLKLSILNETLNEMGGGLLSDISVNTICKRCEISKVTFFKYFPHKEDLPVYFMQTWCLKRNVELVTNQISGLKAIEYLFLKAAEKEYTDRPGIWLSLIGYITQLKEAPSPADLTPMEKRLVLGMEDMDFDLQDGPIPSLTELFLRHTIEAEKSGEMIPANRESFLLHLTTIFYGAPLTAHMRKGNLKSIYTSQLNTIFQQFKTT